jgi:hypothetical protein
MMATDTVVQAPSDAAFPVLVMDADAARPSRGGSAEDPARLVDNALRAVLGARTRSNDAAGFRAALARSFVQTEVDGRRTYRNVPSGTSADVVDAAELSGFQATLLARAREVVERGLPLLDGLRSLVPTSDVEDAAALVSVVRTAVVRLRDEFGRRDGPRAVLVEQQLRILLGDDASAAADPDLVRGGLGAIRDHLGLASGQDRRANTVEEEQQVTSYRLLVEYVVGLRQSWTTAAPFFGAGASSSQTFLSARLRRLDLTLQTVADAVDRVRSQLDTVYVGEAERRIHPLPLPSRPQDGLTVEDLLEWAADVASPETAVLLRDGGRIVIADSLLPNAVRVRDLLAEAAAAELPGNLGAARVRAAFDELAAQFSGLVAELQRLIPLTAGESASGPVGGGAGARVVLVPAVVGRSVKKARKALRREGLELALGQARTADTGRVNDVLATDPPAGAAVASGTEVRVDYLAALTRATVPDVRELPFQQATARITAARLVVGHVTVDRSRTQAPGTVLRTSPSPRTVVDPGQPVDLTVAAADPHDLYELLCGLVPLAETAASVGREAVGRLRRVTTMDGQDCSEEVRSSAQVVSLLAELLRMAATAPRVSGPGRHPGIADVVTRAMDAWTRALHDMQQQAAGSATGSAAGRAGSSKKASKP